MLSRLIEILCPGTSGRAPVCTVIAHAVTTMPSNSKTFIDKSSPVCDFAVVVADCPGFFRARALGRRFYGVGAASGDVVQSSTRDVAPDDRSLGPDYRGREVDFRRRLVLLLNRQGPGEPRRRPPTQVVVNHVGHHFDRRRVLHFAAVLAAVVADQVGAVPKPLTEYLQARGPVVRLDLRNRYDGVGRTGTTFRTCARAVATAVRHTPTTAESCRCGHRSGELRVVGCAPTYNHPVFSRTRVSTVLSTAAVTIFGNRNGKR